MKNKHMLNLRSIIIASFLLLSLTILSSIAQQQGNELKDIDGNTYKTVIIGNQQWMGENLKTTKYNDGSDIPHVTDMQQWVRITTPAYSWYNNDVANKNDFGALYNWFAVNTGKLCPAGWRVPADEDWTILTDYLGGERVAGGKLKTYDTVKWTMPNSGATNEANFSAIPGGYRYGTYWGSGISYEKGVSSYWWTQTEYTFLAAWSRTVTANANKTYRSFFEKNTGFSVRCIKE